MAYEPGMAIVFDSVTKAVIVSFRGVTVYLPGPYADRKAAVPTAEAHCRRLGWRDRLRLISTIYKRQIFVL
ncbi:hypothetical protein [Rhizobium leguminosarum]|jgi:hypothetical protein|uniref:hypothetical protein n=1 Tax=Rhizobium TaxID=379 RepID=UPI00102FAC61|nr:hypothetical protein [Rhizobium leguminosarum]TAV88401.1 hypothetical protein ELI22_03745 [Rhizobium leguminosarum]TAV92981.1 hypothetical protein ELI21_03730 [Rhizobium leguminosarum]TAW34057.1 hypothetical protein ELI23_03770 [Rhizobium leguminosarum]TAX59377.1 hypothetical protein ELI02_04750 [Rhizobium leguminosarum]